MHKPKEADERDLNRLPYMPWFVGDWLSSATIEAFTVEQEGAYARLLMRAWQQPDCGLPDDDTVLARFSRLGARWKKVGRPIIAAAFVREDGRLFNAKQREVWQKVQGKCTKAKEAADERWKRERERRRNLPLGGNGTGQ